MKLKLIAFFIFGMFCLVSFHSCDGIFPTASKSGVPSDHTTAYGGFYHKTSGGNRVNITDCLTCHSLELPGKVTVINGVKTWANSCYQCHGNLWKDRGGK